MHPLITATELLNIRTDANLVIADVSNSPDARENYDRNHLENAIFVDLNKDLATIIDPKSGGRHPLPATGDFVNALSNLGISKQSHVVIYDNHFGSNAAARFWWMLKAIGHSKVQVLDGGFVKAVESGFPVTDKATKIQSVSAYENSDWNLPLVTIDDVRTAINKRNHLIVDVREKHRYDGDSEPIDLVAGHIPSAINVPFKTNLDQNGNFRKPADLRGYYSGIIGDWNESEVIVHCGSGVTACHTLLAFAVAGLQIPNLYVGSWSEWSRNQ